MGTERSGMASKVHEVLLIFFWWHKRNQSIAFSMLAKFQTLTLSAAILTRPLQEITFMHVIEKRASVLHIMTEPEKTFSKLHCVPDGPGRKCQQFLTSGRLVIR